MSDTPDDQLWAAYLDWCSAQVAKHFLTLSSDEVWALARETTGQRPSEPPGYGETVQHIAVLLFQRLGLPDFATWSADYQRDPAAIDRDTASVLGPLGTE